MNFAHYFMFHYFLLNADLRFKSLKRNPGNRLNCLRKAFLEIENVQ